MDAADLREFYASNLGGVSRRLIARRLRAHFDSVAGRSLLGIGFALPYLDGWRGSAERTLAFTMARQGVIHWPAGNPAAVALVDECELPLLESSIDLILMIHALELTDDPQDMLREVWRVLSPQGRVLIVVPNRRGMWARSDGTPYGHGQPFSRTQLSRLLKDSQFSPVSWSYALFMPPSERAIVLRTATGWERAGLRMSPAFAGVIMVEAVKQVYAIPKGKRQRRYLPRLKPVLLPQPARRQAPAGFAFDDQQPYEEQS
jgi:SAM-dependent methyltransferase